MPCTTTGAAKIAIRNHANRSSRLLIRHNGHGTDIAIAQDSSNGVCAVGEHAAGRILAHDSLIFMGDL
jgi:hypothetical protein